MWSQLVMALLGIWLMVAPAALDFSKKISDNAHIVGPLIASFSIIAMSECTRNVRWLNALFGVWLFAAPWVLQYGNNTALWNDYAVAVLIIALCFVKPKRKKRFGGGWPAAWRSDTVHSRMAGNPRRIHIEIKKTD
jgi:hypothetical protein